MTTRDALWKKKRKMCKSRRIERNRWPTNETISLLERKIIRFMRFPVSSRVCCSRSCFVAYGTNAGLRVCRCCVCVLTVHHPDMSFHLQDPVKRHQQQAQRQQQSNLQQQRPTTNRHVVNQHVLRHVNQPTNLFQIHS